MTNQDHLKTFLDENGATISVSYKGKTRRYTAVISSSARRIEGTGINLKDAVANAAAAWVRGARPKRKHSRSAS